MQGQIVKATQEWASLITNLQWQKVWRRAPKWVAFILVILVAKSAADVTWLVFAPKETSHSTSRRYQRMQTTGPAPARLRSVSDMHLFGVAAKPVVAREAPIEAKETQLKLTLRGVFAADDPERAMAIIADARGQEKVYRRNETIFAGVSLYAVYPDRVILERSGNYETLSLPRDDDKSNHSSSIRSSVSRRPAVAKPEPGMRTRTIQANKQLEAMRQQIIQDPQEFWKNVRIEPHYDSSNQVDGYTFEHNNRQLMQAMGLRPGDVIVEINGQPVSDPSVLSGLMGQLPSASHLSLGIERNGQRQTLNINM